MPTDEHQNNKRIAKNTLLLYFRMLLTMAANLYTSRVILQALGVENFGIYNVVGGVVAMFSILSGSLSAAISRFLTFELGKQDMDRLKKVFSASVSIQILLAVLIAILAEIVGYWFVNNRMNIPIERLCAANWVLHFSVVTFCINLISVPYNAAIIAHEKMGAFAYVSILEALGKLAIAWAVVFSPIDKLKYYAVLMCGLAFVVRIVYGWYCKSHFRECKLSLNFDGKLLKQMFSFAGWNFIGAASSVLRDQGGNILLNLFFGPTVNAARGIAFQVQGTVLQFSGNFMTALNPQITKSYANNDSKYMMTLIVQGARLSFYMLLLITLPLMLNTEYILSAWLTNVPEKTVLFTQLSIVFVIIEAISSPLITAMLATGNIRNYQIVVGGLQMMNFPVCYVLLKYDFPAESIFVVAIILSNCCLFARLFMLREMIKLDVCSYLKNVYLNVLQVFCVSYIPLFALRKECFIGNDAFSFLFICLISVVYSFVIILFLGCNKVERQMVWTKMLFIKQRVLKR